MAKHGPDEGWRQHVLNNVLPRMEASSTAGTAGFEPAPANPQPFSVGMHLQPQFDVIELLPERAQGRLRALRLRSADSHALIPDFSEIQAASNLRIDADNRLKTLLAHPQEFGRGLRPDDPLVQTATKHLEKMTGDFKRLTELREVRAAAWQTASQAKAAVESWLRDGKPHGTTLEEVETEPPKLNKGEDILTALEKIRRRGRELRADAHRVASAQYPANYTKEKMRRQISRLAERGEPSVASLVELDGDVEFQTMQMQSQVIGGAERSLAFHEATDPTALICWIFQAEVVKRLDAAIDAETDSKTALSHADRELRTGEIMNDLIAVERQEAELCFLAQAQGLPVEHRADISPLALLGVRLVTTPRAEASPETSPGHSWVLRR